MAWPADLVTIRDKMVAEVIAELTRRAGLVALGHPPPTDASLNGLSVSWNVYFSTMLEQIKKADEMVVKTGAGAGIGEEWVKMYT